MKFPIFIFLLLPILTFSQQQPGSDILILKKGNKTLIKYFKGSNIQFFTTEGMPVQGIVDGISNDSLVVINYKIMRIQRQDGGVVFDTSGRFKSLFSILNIGGFPIVKKPKGKNLLTNGTALMIGSAGYLGLNLINTLRDGDPPFGKDNIQNIYIAAGIFGSGLLLSKLWPKKYTIGKKYSIKVLKMS